MFFNHDDKYPKETADLHYLFQSRAVLLYDPVTDKRQGSMVSGASNHGGVGAV